MPLQRMRIMGSMRHAALRMLRSLQVVTSTFKRGPSREKIEMGESLSILDSQQEFERFKQDV